MYDWKMSSLSSVIFTTIFNYVSFTCTCRSMSGWWVQTEKTFTWFQKYWLELASNFKMIFKHSYRCLALI